jgi:hypothetical protein
MQTMSQLDNRIDISTKYLTFLTAYLNRSQWSRGIRRGSAAAWLLGLRVRIPLGAWMFVSCE